LPRDTQNFPQFLRSNAECWRVTQNLSELTDGLFHDTFKLVILEKSSSVSHVVQVAQD